MHPLPPGPTPHVVTDRPSPSSRPHLWWPIFLSYYRPYLGLLVADLACAFVVALLALAFPLMARFITGHLLTGDAPIDLTPIYAAGAVMVGLIAVQVACNTFVDYRGHMLGTLIERDIRRDLFDHYQKLPYHFHDTQRTGQLMSRITSDLEAISELAHHGPEDLLIAAVKFIGAFAVLIFVNPSLTWAVFLLLPVMAAYALHFNRRLNAARLVSRERMGDVNAQVEDSLAGVRVVQAFANEDIEALKFARQNERFVQTRREIYHNEAWFYQGVLAFTQGLTLIVIVLGGLLIARQQLQLADLITFLLLIGVLIDPVQRFVNFARVSQEGVTGFTRFMQIMEISPDIHDAPDAVPLQHVQGHIEFRNVSFAYREGSEHVLSGLNLTLRPGEVVALVGPSGAGKTTLSALIPRLYEVTAGQVRIDGHDVRGVTLSSLRRQIGVVQQDVYLFAGTLEDNIRYGRPGATPQEIMDAARHAQAHDFISALPDGYATEVGQRGVRLSGGQKQRISIARLFLKQPSILILDEATSALDTHSERAVQDALTALRDGRTTLIIAHRLTTIQQADRILVLTEDGVVEDGTHHQLLSQGGVYARLHGAALSL